MRWINIIGACLGICCLLIGAIKDLYAQNLYDEVHSIEFAHYLIESQQYTYAAQEFERLVHLNPTSDSIKAELIQTYRLGTNYEAGLKRANFFYEDAALMPAVISLAYTEVLIESDQLFKTERFLHKSVYLPTINKNTMYLNLAMLNQNWARAEKWLEKYPDSLNLKYHDEYVSIMQEGQNMRFKSPAIALGLSAVVPGLGRVYSKDWKDGLFSFMMVGTMAFQSYRGFAKRGTESVYGWAFGAVALGFYSGNLYGSYKSAKTYNNRLKHGLAHRTKQLVVKSF